ncbi:MAG: NAD-dependent epimerase/dehydratase family protein [Dehalobacter sp. 4CP]|uniref:NAD-dependent epimerase/dehydratase family protein n=1 Tax=Dehalobacter sp. CP TaxID=2594474 RepID=UPI0013CC905F|nr:NAD-dependent epimerase/dehydratase family protein [Dehalobacter sp. 4CP]
METTIIGANGFIGKHLVNELKKLGQSYFAPDRNDDSVFHVPLGNVIYCAGLSSDFRSRPFDTVRAHVTLLSDLLEKSSYHSFLYLSSTRIYINTTRAEEDADLTVNPRNSEDIFNISKLMGESICHATNNPKVRIARLSNVCGNDFSSDNFLYSIIKNAVSTGEVTFRTSLSSAKDYIAIDDVARILLKILSAGKQKTYNVASGQNISHLMIADLLQKLTCCKIHVADHAVPVTFPKINIDRISKEFHYTPSDPLILIKDLILKYQRNQPNTFLKSYK